MALEADRMENLDFGKKAFDKERDVVFQERMQVVENNPSSYFGESLRRVLWQQHPYSRPISGSPEEIKSVSRADVMDFIAAIMRRTMRYWFFPAILSRKRPSCWRKSILANQTAAGRRQGRFSETGQAFCRTFGNETAAD